jgi:hypothetical protein
MDGNSAEIVAESRLHRAAAHHRRFRADARARPPIATIRSSYSPSRLGTAARAIELR